MSTTQERKIYKDVDNPNMGQGYQPFTSVQAESISVRRKLDKIIKLLCVIAALLIGVLIVALAAVAAFG